MLGAGRGTEIIEPNNAWFMQTISTKLGQHQFMMIPNAPRFNSTPTNRVWETRPSTCRDGGGL